MVAKTRNGRAPIRELTEEEGRAYFDEQVQRVLGMSTDEFVRKWQAYEFGDPDDTNPDLWNIAMLLPLVGVDPWHVEPHPQGIC